MSTSSTRKRKRSPEPQTSAPKRQKTDAITAEFTNECRDEIHNDPARILARNTMTLAGAPWSTTNWDVVQKANHRFLVSLKKHNIRATSQESSGRCWIFAGLNTLRHQIATAFDLSEFEFSQLYVFFWDQYEKSNAFLVNIMETLDEPIDSRIIDMLLWEPVGDGGFFGWFANLVSKYGIIPKEAMPETAHSSDTHEIGRQLCTLLRSSAHKMRSLENPTRDQLLEIKDSTMKQVYDNLVVLMGKPPRTFDWTYTSHDDGVRHKMVGLSPSSFLSMMPTYKPENQVCITNFPIEEMPFGKTYSVKYMQTVVGSRPLKFLNLPIDDLKKYTAKSIRNGMPVWFAGDVGRGYHWLFNLLDDDVMQYDPIYGAHDKLNKSERIKYRDQYACHAMTILGYDYDTDSSKPTRWQVENSWGYWDDETPGWDGFPSMTDKWFGENVMMVIIDIDDLSRTDQAKFKQDPIELMPWDIGTAAMKTGGGNSCCHNQMKRRKNAQRNKGGKHHH